MSDFYSQLCNILIRPNRQIYHFYDLGSPIINNYGKREDFQIYSRENLKLKCSYYLSTHNKNIKSNFMPTIIYLHSINGSRLQFLTNVQSTLKLGFSICTLDLSGCGLSDGQYVTLGALEKWDVLEVTKYVQKTYNNSNFIIWGRSMGAVTAIKFYNLLAQQRQHNIQLRNIKLIALVLDSPFVSLNQLAIEIAKNKINMPQILLKMAFFMIQGTIQSKAKFKISQLQLFNEIPNIHIPTLIMTSKNDTLISYQHSLTIYNAISSINKELLYLQTQHNQNRQMKDIKKVYQFLLNNSSQFRINLESYIQQQSRPKSLKKYQTSEISRQKLNKNASQKTSIHASKKSQIQIQNYRKIINHSNSMTPNNNLHQYKINKIQNEQLLLQNKQINNIQTVKVLANYQNHRKFHSEQRASHNYFSNKNMSKDQSEKNSLNRKSLQKYHATLKNNLNSIPQANSLQKPLKQTKSYKNIQCLKTVKKIKKLQNQNIKNQNIIQKEDKQKYHLNIINSKLKKKSKYQINKSFLLQRNQIQQKIQKPFERNIQLKKDFNTKSQTSLQYQQNKCQSNLNNEVFNFKRQNTTSPPVFFSNRIINFNDQPIKPFTPQIISNSSKRLIQIHNHRKKSFDQNKFIKNNQIPNPRNSPMKGIRTTLNPKHSQDKKLISNFRFNNQEQIMTSAQFLMSKKILTSQHIINRNTKRFDDSKKYVLFRKQPSSLKQSFHETSITFL